MTRSRDGEALLRDALLRRRVHWSLDDLAVSLGTTGERLDAFADNRGVLPDHTLSALAKILFRAEFDTQTRAIRSYGRQQRS